MDEDLCCRVCLVTDCKLFNIYEYKLADTLADVSGTSVGKDGLPQYLCLCCRRLLLKCASFRAMCRKTQQVLTSELLKGEVNRDGIRKLDRLSHRLVNLTLSVVCLVDCVDTPEKHVKSEPNDTDEYNTDEIKIKKNVELEIHSNHEDCDVSDDKDKIRDNIVERDDINVKHEKKKNYIEKRDIGDNNEDVLALNVINLRPKKRPTVATIRKTVGTEKKSAQVKKRKVEFEADDDTNSMKGKWGRRPQNEEKKRVFRDPKNDNLPVFDFSKFENDYGVKIVTLSKQEQLEEIAARKESVNYKESRFKCEDCGKGFDTQATHINHTLRHNPNAGQYSCEICAVRFKRRCLQHRHQDLHRLKFVCQECGFISRQSGNAKVHYEVHQGRRFICDHCGETYSKRSSYLSHVRLQHPALHAACEECGETFVGRGLAMHKKLTHCQNTQPQKFNCLTCSASFVSLDALNRHTDSGEHTGSPCEQCGESCVSEDALHAHVGERHPKESHRCEECRATFVSARVFELHYRRKHLGERGAAPAASTAARARKRQARVKPRRPPPRKQLVCETCGHIAQNAALLRYHQNNHLAVKPFPCPVCPKTFATNGIRNWHARKHSGEQPFKCPLCPLAFNAKCNFKRHHRTVHLGLHEKVPCDICGRVFTTKSSVRLHVKYVHNGQPWPKRDRTRTKKEHQLK